MSAQSDACRHCGAPLRNGEIARHQKALAAVLRRYALMERKQARQRRHRPGRREGRGAKWDFPCL